MKDNHNQLNETLKEFLHIFKEIMKGHPIWRIAIYVRLSKEDGNTISLSITNQLKLIAKYLQTLQDYVIFDIYIDDGLTGTDFDRSGYMRLQNDIENKMVNCVIVKDITRYSRNFVEGIKELDSYVLEHNIRFISLGIPKLDTLEDPRAISGPELYQALQNAEDFARSTSIKVRDAKQLNRDDGLINGGFPPYGYLPNPDGKHWLYDPVAGEIIQQMYLWSVEGLSDREIARKLNSQNIPNPTLYKQQIGLKYYNPHAVKNSGLWWPQTVKRILEDKNNIGCSVQGKTSAFDHKRHKQIPKKKEDYVIVANCHEKAVPDELFERVQAVRSQRTRISKNTGVVHMFANLVFCSRCERTMQKTSSRGKHYLVCRTYKILGKEYCSSKRSITIEALEKIVLNTIQIQISLIADIQSMIADINKQPVIHKRSTRVEQLIEHTTQEIVKNERMLDMSYYDWKSETISKEQFQRVRNEVESKLSQLKEALYHLSTEQKQIAKGINAENSFFQMFLKYQNATSLNRVMLVELVKRIVIDEDKNVKVEFNFNDQYLLIMDYIEQNRKPQKILEKRK